MKELLKKIIFEQQEYCKNIAQETVPRGIEEEWLTTTVSGSAFIPLYYKKKQ